MKSDKKLNARKASRIARVRARVSGTTDRPRLAVFRSNTGITAQLIDDVKGITLGYVSSKAEKLKGKKTEAAFAVGEKIASIAKEKKITKAVFDRRSYQFHGRVKAVAEGARKAGLTL